MSTYGWGPNTLGEVGVGDTAIHRTPTLMAGSADFIETAGGAGSYAIGLATDRTVYTWGSNNGGQLGIGTSDALAHSTPVQVPGLTNIIRTEVGGECKYALDSSGVLYGWGKPTNGELAQANTTQQNSPVTVATGVVDFSAGADNLIVLFSGGVVQTVGANNAGQLAIGSSGASHSTFSTVTPGSGTVVGVAGGQEFHVLLMADGSLQGAGASIAGQLGNTNSINSSWITLPHTSAVEMWVGQRNVWIRRADGTVWATGLNVQGQLGMGTADGLFHTTLTQLLVPVGVTPTQFTHSCAALTFAFLTSTGTIYTWGRGDGGGMGNGGTTVSNPTPISVNGLTGQVWIGGGQLGMWAGDQVAPSLTRPRGYAAVIG